jgi:uncharacterized membrane protein
MLQAKAPLVLLAFLALGATGCGHRMSRSYRVVRVPVYVPTVVIYQNGRPDYGAAQRHAQAQAAQEAADREAFEAQQRAQEDAAREQAARAAAEQAAREQAAREAAEREAAAREQERIAQEQAAARAKAAQAAQGGTTIIILGPNGAMPQGQGRQAAPGVWISGE